MSLLKRPNLHANVGSTQRIEAFSDGIFAFNATLLVLELHVPELTNGSLETFLNNLMMMGPKFLGFFISFVTIAIFWVNHHHFFHALKATDRHILWWNLNLLFWLSLVPLPTYFLAQHPLKPEALALYGFNGFTASLSFTLMGHYARAKKLMHHKLSKRRGRRLNRMNWTGISLYFISIFAGYLSVYISYAIFIMIPAMYFIPQKIELED